MEDYIFKIENLLYDVHDKNPGLISHVESRRNNALTMETISQLKSLNLDPNLLKLYKQYNGLTINWIADEKTGIGGRIHLLPLEQIVVNWEGKLYESIDVPENADIKLFHPFDLISSEAQCGIIIDPKGLKSQIAYNFSGEAEIEFLQLDFKGYLTMALEARVYNYWPKVILDITNNNESPETISFKENMPKIFKDFSFKRFVEQYHSCKISNE